MDDDNVEGIPWQSEIVNVAMAYAAMFQPGAVEPRPRQRQHIERQIEAKAALDIVGEEFEHAASAGAEIEKRTDGLFAKCATDSVFDGGVGDVQLADAVPFGGVPPEVILCGGATG